MPAPPSPAPPAAAPWRDGDDWINAATGVRIQVETSAASSGGKELTLLVTFPPASPQPPLHYHPAQTETFTFLAGSLRVTHHGQTAVQSAGETLVIRPREAHAMWNPFDAPAVVRWQTNPALRTEQWLAQLLALAAAGRTNDVGVPGFPQLALLLRTYRSELRLCQPPAWVQALLFPPAACLGRWLGGPSRPENPSAQR